MKFNASRTDTIFISRSCTIHPQSTLLTLNGTVLNESADLFILDVTVNAKMTFEKRLCFLSRGAAQKLGIMRKS